MPQILLVNASQGRVRVRELLTGRQRRWNGRWRRSGMGRRRCGEAGRTRQRVWPSGTPSRRCQPEARVATRWGRPSSAPRRLRSRTPSGEPPALAAPPGSSAWSPASRLRVRQPLAVEPVAELSNYAQSAANRGRDSAGARGRRGEIDSCGGRRVSVGVSSDGPQRGCTKLGCISIGLYEVLEKRVLQKRKKKS